MKKIVAIISIISLSIACSPEDGEDGAMGPQGPQGEQGMIGPQGVPGQDGENGAQGEQGETGTANVIYSEWFTLNFPEDIGGDNYTASISTPDVTQEIVDSGVVLIYARFDAPAIVPRLLPFSSFSLQQYYAPGFRAPTNTSPTGRVSVTIWSMDGTPIGAPLFDEYRYIIIPGGIPNSGKSTLDYSKMSYPEITILFNIPD